MSDLEVYCNMLRRAEIDFMMHCDPHDAKWTIDVESTPGVGYRHFSARHVFDRYGKLIGVGGTEE